MAFSRSSDRTPPARLPASCRAARVRAPLGVLALGLALGGAQPAAAQQNQEWFVPGQGGGGQRPAQAQQPQRQQQRPPARQGQPPTAVIGIVDVPEIQRESTAFNQVREEIEKRRQKLNDDLQREQTAWRDAQQQLANQRAAMPPDQLRQRERDLQDRITDSQRIFRERSRAIEQAAQQALLEIEQALAQIIRQTAVSRSVNLVVPRQLVIFNDPAFDLTQEIAQQFNRQLRSVTIPPEGAAPAADAPAAPAQPPAAQGQQRPPAAQGQQGQRR